MTHKTCVCTLDDGNIAGISSFTMWKTSFFLAALTINSVVVDARRLHKRECSYTWPATDGDTCATISRDWLIDEKLFTAMNPGIDCSKLVPGQEYCVEWNGPPPTGPVVTPNPSSTSAKVSSTTMVTKTSSSVPDGPAAPSPIQSGFAHNCKF
jgi:hypothetical protein